jgi:hypothetical protein
MSAESFFKRRTVWSASWTLAAALLWSPGAKAYRPFDGTDGDVAERGSFELEMGPVHYYRRAGQNYLIAPATVLNFGIFADTELVFDFENTLASGALAGRPRLALLGTDVFLKHVLRKGILQEASGLSIAVEFGPLTPEIHGTNAFGASANLILSYRWDFATLHFNELSEYSREHELVVFSGVIAEGPRAWPVRPVTEIFYEQPLHPEHRESRLAVERTLSGLVGFIWPVRTWFALDLAVRGAKVGDESESEVRFGFTWVTPSAE